MAGFAPGFVGLALIALWIWAVFDVITTDRAMVRNLDKSLWLFLVICLLYTSPSPRDGLLSRMPSSA